MYKDKVLLIVAVLLITTMLVSVGFTAILNVTAQPGSMSTLQKILSTYAVSIIPGAAQRNSTISLLSTSNSSPSTYYSRMV